MNDEIRFIEALHGGPYPVCDHTQLAMFMAGQKTYVLDEAVKHFKQSRQKLLKLWEGGVASRARADAEAIDVDWFESLSDPRVQARLNFYARNLGRVSKADFLVCLCDEWDQCDPEEKDRMMLESIGYRSEHANIYSHEVGPVENIKFRFKRGLPVPLPPDDETSVDETDVYSVRGLAKKTGWARAALVLLHNATFPPEGGD